MAYHIIQDLQSLEFLKHSHYLCIPEVMEFQLRACSLGNITLKPLTGKAWLAWKLPGPWTPAQPEASFLPYLPPELWDSERQK